MQIAASLVPVSCGRSFWASSVLCARSRGRGFAAVVRRGRSDRLTGLELVEKVLTEGRVLAAGEALRRSVGAAELELKICELLCHLVGVRSGLSIDDSSLEMAKGVEIVAGDVILSGAWLRVIEMIPCVEGHVAFAIREEGINLGPPGAIGAVYVPYGDAVAAGDPVGGPLMSAEIEVEGGEVGAG